MADVNLQPHVERKRYALKAFFGKNGLKWAISGANGGDLRVKRWVFQVLKIRRIHGFHARRRLNWGGNCGFGPLVARGSQLRGLVLARPDLAVEPGRREQAAVTAARRRPTETAHDASKRPLREARPRPAAFAGAFRSIQSGCGWGGKALAECGPRR